MRSHVAHFTLAIRLYVLYELVAKTKGAKSLKVVKLMAQFKNNRLKVDKSRLIDVCCRCR